ncbi:MAG: sigma-70 family RNA polymerase sigma factor [Gammaproteobacteria bacterium]|nr:sigma-70 family RNA polymerase sigma factor [Gammaproteobacteria bacterium]
MTGAPFDREALQSAYRYCLALTGHEAAAYDLLQDGLERYLRGVEAAENPRAMLYRILHNRFIDTRRTSRDTLHDDIDALDDHCLSLGFHGLDDMVIAQQELAIIWQGLAPAERELLHLWAVEGHTAQEVAEQLGEPRGTVLSRIHRLRRRLEAERAHRSGNQGGVA